MRLGRLATAPRLQRGGGAGGELRSRSAGRRRRPRTPRQRRQGPERRATEAREGAARGPWRSAGGAQDACGPSRRRRRSGMWGGNTS